jgi:hypothetical protein
MKLLKKVFGKKKKFLENDHIERMIRVEQKVVESFGDAVNYNETHFYGSLSAKDKTSYRKYLKRKSMKKVLAFIPLLAILLVFALANVQFTGNVIEEEVDNFGLEVYLAAALLGIVGVYFVVLLAKKIKNIKFNKHFKIIDEIGLKRYVA